MVKENTKRKPATKPASKKRVRYVPASEPLLAKWNELKAERHYAQKAMGLSANTSEGSISQFLNGTTALTIEMALQFSLYMGVSVVDIWPDFPFARLVPGSLSPEEVEFALRYRMSRHKKAIANFLKETQDPS